LKEGVFTVVRFKNEEVLENSNVVCDFLEDWIEKKLVLQTSLLRKSSL